MIALRSVRRAADVRQFIKFLIVGGFNTLVGYALFALFYLLGAPPALAVIAATTIGTAINFASTGRIVFRSKAAAQLPRFVIVYAAQCIVNLALLRALVGLGMTPLVAQAVLLPLIAVLTFAGLRHFVFTKARP